MSAGGVSGSELAPAGAGGSGGAGGTESETQFSTHGGTGGSDEAGLDASTSASPEPDAGRPPTGILVSFPEWTLPDYLLCYCNDDTTHEMCLDFDVDDVMEQDRICGSVCALHGGESATGSEASSPFCDRPTIDGPDHLTCQCMDGYEESLCVDLACFSDDQRLNLCTPYCGDHGGTASTECEDFDYDLCIPPGDTLVTCGCADGDEVRICTSNDCSQGVFAGEDCHYSCIDKGGAEYSGCHMDEPSCAMP